MRKVSNLKLNSKLLNRFDIYLPHDWKIYRPINFFFEYPVINIETATTMTAMVLRSSTLMAFWLVQISFRLAFFFVFLLIIRLIFTLLILFVNNKPLISCRFNRTFQRQSIIHDAFRLNAHWEFKIFTKLLGKQYGTIVRHLANTSDCLFWLALSLDYYADRRINWLLFAFVCYGLGTGRKKRVKSYTLYILKGNFPLRVRTGYLIKDLNVQSLNRRR